ncbi:FAD-binding oxidoreductase [haloarchaeon 3A1-DGR]|nr:FAD-binding oxidoreductase [haloarchaeon 3A1-DGR]
MEVTVVGGGIVGLASAYFLAERGADVTVLEKSAVGAGSTDRANGGIRSQFASPVNVELSKASVPVWESFAERFDTDVEYRQMGYLFLAREEATATQLRRNVRTQNDHGVPSEFLEPGTVADRFPELRTADVVGASFLHTDGWADPHLGLQGFSRAATEAGATVETGVEVTDVLRPDDGAVTGVETTAGRFRSDFVVNAAGAWAGEVAAMAGVDVPIVPKRRQLVVLDPETAVPEDHPFAVDVDRSTHFRPERDGGVVAGGRYADHDPEMDPDGFRTRHDLDWAVEVLDRLTDVASYFGPETEMRRGWAGLYAMTPDHHPIIEETVPGFVNACGFSGHGFMHSPATGQVVSELVLDGAASTVDISELTADRFERGETLAETTAID